MKGSGYYGWCNITFCTNNIWKLWKESKDFRKKEVAQLLFFWGSWVQFYILRFFEKLQIYFLEFSNFSNFIFRSQQFQQSYDEIELVSYWGWSQFLNDEDGDDLADNYDDDDDHADESKDDHYPHSSVSHFQFVPPIRPWQKSSESMMTMITMLARMAMRMTRP